MASNCQVPSRICLEVLELDEEEEELDEELLDEVEDPLPEEDPPDAEEPEAVCRVLHCVNKRTDNKNRVVYFMKYFCVNVMNYG